MVGSGMLNGVFEALIIFFIIIICLVGLGAWLGGKYFYEKDYIESKHIIHPQKRLITDGKTVDTLYIYRSK